MNPDEQWTRTWGKDRIIALGRDPQSLFVYWELGERRKWLIGRHFRTDWESLSCCLHVNDVTDIEFTGDNAHWNRFQTVPAHADHAYVDTILSDRDYIVDFGVSLASGHFFTILRASPVSAPPRTRPTGETSIRFGRLGVVSYSSRTRGTLGTEVDRRSLIPYEETFDGYSVLERRVQ